MTHDLLSLPPEIGSTHADTTRSFWEDLNRITIRVVMRLSFSATVVDLGLYFILGARFFLVMAASGFVIGANAFRQRLRSETDAASTLSVAAITLTGVTALAAPEMSVVIWGTLPILASMGALMTPGARRARFLVLIGLLLGAQGLWPVVGVASLAKTAMSIIATVAATVAGVYVVTLARRTLDFSDKSRIEISRRVPVGLFRASPEGVIIDGNPALMRMLGYEDDSLIGKNAPALHGDLSRWQALIDGLHDGSSRKLTWRLHTVQGATIWVRGFIQATFAADGTMAHVEGAIEDITEGRLAEKEARLNAERFRAVFNRAPIAIWEEDFTAVGARLAELRQEGVTNLRSHLTDHPEETLRLIRLVEYVDVNPAGVELLRAASAEEALANVVAEEPTPDVLDSFIPQFDTIWNDRDHLELEITGSTVSGDPTDLVLSWAAARGPDGSLDLKHVVVAIADVHLVREAERELAQLINSKDELVASVSHELRTPITTILGMAYELRDHAESFNPQETRDLIALIADQSRELSNIVDDLLVAARTDLDTLAVRPEMIDLNEEVSLVVMSSPPDARPAIEAHGGVAAWADPLRLRQIVRNLLTNARRYGGPNVSIVTGRRSGEIFLQVRDDGPGIASADREAVFEPYIRSSTDRALPGSIGLGLPVSRRLARLMGGELVYRYENGQSVFELTLPEPVRSAVA